MVLQFGVRNNFWKVTLLWNVNIMTAVQSSLGFNLMAVTNELQKTDIQILVHTEILTYLRIT